MEIEHTIYELKAAELTIIIDALNAKGGKYEWTSPDNDEDDAMPWATIYMGDSVWHDVKVSSIELLGTKLNVHFRVKGLDSATGDMIERIVWPGELSLGDLYNIAAYID